jgi:hypothetical protein
MPFNSEAQRRNVAQLPVDGRISAPTFEQLNREPRRRA